MRSGALTAGAVQASLAGMERREDFNTDSSPVSGAGWGGVIPGSGGVAAFRMKAPVPSVIPVLIAVPHAGRAYPPALLAAMRDPDVAPARLEDRLVDLLAQAVAAQTGAGLLVADAPRAMIDLNRSAHDIDWSMIDNAGDAASAELFAARRRGQGARGARASSGLGLIPRRIPGVGELWKAPLAQAELMARIEGVHQPYHARLADELAELRARWGAALLIDLHSMPPLPVRHALARNVPVLHNGRAGTAQLVLGDRFGASCAGSLVASAFSSLAESRMPAAHNRPYAGGFGVERHGDPSRSIHAMQIEIDRSRYLDSGLRELGEGFGAVVALMVGMVRVLAGEVAVMGAGNDLLRWPNAAE